MVLEDSLMRPVFVPFVSSASSLPLFMEQLIAHNLKIRLLQHGRRAAFDAGKPLFSYLFVIALLVPFLQVASSPYLDNKPCVRVTGSGHSEVSVFHTSCLHRLEKGSCDRTHPSCGRQV